MPECHDVMRSARRIIAFVPRFSKFMTYYEFHKKNPKTMVSSKCTFKIELELNSIEIGKLKLKELFHRRTAFFFHFCIALICAFGSLSIHNPILVYRVSKPQGLKYQVVPKIPILTYCHPF